MSEKKSLFEKMGLVEKVERKKEMKIVKENEIMELEKKKNQTRILRINWMC